jgi:hypothetical protein
MSIMWRMEPATAGEITGDSMFCADCDGYVDVYLDEDDQEMCALCDEVNLFDSAAQAREAYAADYAESYRERAREAREDADRF